MSFKNILICLLLYFLLTSKLYAYVGLAAFIPFLWQIIVAIIIVILSIFLLFYGVIKKLFYKIKKQEKKNNNHN